jgi:VNT family MFS transporter (synaptic vesicle glycoprotein 2)
MKIMKNIKMIITILSQTIFSLGMVFGAYFWGVCGDMKGRRFVILASMGMDALCSVLSSLTQDALYFLIIRIGNGFA